MEFADDPGLLAAKRRVRLMLLDDQLVEGTLAAIAQIAASLTGAVDLDVETSDDSGGRGLERARSFAAYAAVAVENARALQRSQALCGQLVAATASRATIEQAKGILIRQRQCTPDEAFDILRELSQTSNRKLRDVAQALVATARPKATAAG